MKSNYYCDHAHDETIMRGETSYVMEHLWTCIGILYVMLS